jgi:hypothetical protein
MQPGEPNSGQSRLETRPSLRRKNSIKLGREGLYPILSWGTSGGFQGILVAPGFYTVNLSVDGQEFIQRLEVKKDPRSEGIPEDIHEQVKMLIALRDDLNLVSDMNSQIEWMRRQLCELKNALKGQDEMADILTSIDEFEKKLRSIEDELFQPIIAEGDSKSFRYPHKLYCKLSVLAGDVAASVDFSPNEQ